MCCLRNNADFDDILEEPSCVYYFRLAVSEELRRRRIARKCIFYSFLIAYKFQLFSFPSDANSGSRNTVYGEEEKTEGSCSILSKSIDIGDSSVSDDNEIAVISRHPSVEKVLYTFELFLEISSYID